MLPLATLMSAAVLVMPNMFRLLGPLCRVELSSPISLALAMKMVYSAKEPP
jgi:hypothetical protein